MISKDEIKSIANDLKLSDVTVEKDYVLGWKRWSPMVGQFSSKIKL